MNDRFEWETLLRNESELVRRAAVPGGWLVSHVLRTDPPVASALTFVPDADALPPNKVWTAPSSPGAQTTDPVPHDALRKTVGDVVSTGAGGIVTTQAELDCFEVVKTLMASARPDLTLGFIDTPTYFALHLGTPSRWFARLCLTPRSSWVALSLTDENLDGDAPSTLERLPGNWASPVRFGITRAEDLKELKALLLRAVDLAC